MKLHYVINSTNHRLVQLGQQQQLELEQLLDDLVEEQQLLPVRAEVEQLPVKWVLEHQVKLPDHVLVVSADHLYLFDLTIEYN